MINCQINLQKTHSDFRNHQADDSIRCQLPEASGMRRELLYHDFVQFTNRKNPLFQRVFELFQGVVLSQNHLH